MSESTAALTEERAAESAAPVFQIPDGELDEHTKYGDVPWEKSLNDETDKVTDIKAGRALP